VIFPWTAETVEIGIAVIGEEENNGLGGKEEVLPEEEGGLIGRKEGVDEAWDGLKVGRGGNGYGQQAKKSAKWAGQVWEGLTVIGHGWDIFKGGKEEMGSR